MTDEQALVFRKLLDAMMDEAGIDTKHLSLQTNYSTAAISLLKNGHRPLTKSFADALAMAIGGTQSLWLKIYAEIAAGDSSDVASYLKTLKSSRQGVAVTGERASRRLVNHQIMELFAKDSDRANFAQYTAFSDHFGIEDFDKDRIQPTSYDTRIGYKVLKTPNKSKPEQPDLEFVEIIDELTIAPNETVSVQTLEHFEMPAFIECDLSPASTITRKPLLVGNGPIVDPFFNGRLCVDLTNPHSKERKISVDEAFLTVRFTLLDVLPLTDEEMERVYGVRRYNRDRKLKRARNHVLAEE